MYEIWLMLNILYEIALGIWPVVLVVLLLWTALLLLARKRMGAAALRTALLVAVLASAALFVSLPSLTHSAFGNMGYWLDWAALLGIALGLGSLTGLFALPVVALLRPTSPRIAA